ncbi:inner membrane-spanning protein YciB [Marichromatium bheemlicum]|uniref:Inner membrane-spanning protein YciB n=1 Tax=Marichromatium bheemlicum TaxID=365339 RepID=A0ABX1I7X3_9GAMM|nr:inner membrane-spanning protein YciB [Marichromatium bheemlicum]NKN33665.1 septation protein IspZ [Marichromatium bheemlicum]
MKLLIDFFPILLFFVAYKLAGIYVATTVAILASAAQLGWTWWRQRRVETMQLVTLGLLVVFGGMTLALRDPIFVMWKPTIVNWLFAAAFLASQLIGRRTLVERTMGHAVSVESAVWRRLNLMWIAFFLVLGLTNLFVVYVASGFFASHQALLASTGLASVDLGSCSTLFEGELLGLCTEAQAGEEVWVNFKLFGMMGMTLVFVLFQAFYLARHIEDEPRPQEAD